MKRITAERVVRLHVLIDGQALDNLTPRMRDVLRLSLSGLEDGEIATMLGLSLSTVKVHQMRLKERLRAKA